MQQLHLVGLTTENDSLICSARKGAKTGSFVLPVDERLLQVIADAVQKRNADGIAIEVPEALLPAAPAAPRRQSHLSPREIQDRLRAGRSLEIIAAEAGVGEEWVARFAAPVEAERLRVINRARSLTFYRPRHGDSGEALGMAVRWNLADKGVRLADDEFDASWSAYQLADLAWIVTFTFESRKRTHEAEWEVDLATGELLSRNRMATELGYVESGRRRRTAAFVQPVPATGRAMARPAAEVGDVEGPADDGPVPNGRTRRPAARKTAAKKAAAKKASTAKKAAASGRRKRTAGTRPPAKKVSAAAGTRKRATPSRPPAKKASVSTRAAAKKAAAAGTRKRAASSLPAANKTAKKAAKKSPTKRSAPRKASAAKKASTRRTTRTRGVPPAATAAVAVAAEAAVPNELGRRRMQLATGTLPAPPRPARRPAAAVAAPPASGVRIAAVRSGDVAPRPTTAPPPKPEVVRPEPGLDVANEEAMAEARRAERRRARAEAREREQRAAAAARASTPPATAADTDDDDRVVTIRANRATPPTGDAELVLPADRPPLRPAQPATQPKKRRFGRTTR